MGLSITVGPASGRARCKICEQMITKGQLQVYVTGWQTSGNIHNSPWDCDQAQRGADVAELIEAAVKRTPRAKKPKVIK